MSLSRPHYEHVIRPVSKLVTYPRNARTHPEPQIISLTKAIKEFGFTSPCLIDENDGLIAGHARVAAAQRLGIPEVPCIVVSGLSEAQKRALVISDNKIALNAGWNDELLIMELGDIASDGLIDIETLGFSQFEVEALLGAGKGAGLTDPDDAPEPPVVPVSVLGDVWVMGRHRIGCGDSACALHIERLMAGAMADICFTSPPYAQQRDYKSGPGLDWDALMQGVFGVLPVADDAQVLVNLGLVHRECEWQPYWSGWIDWMRNAGWRRFGWYVWDQGFGLPGAWNGRLAPSHEFVFHFNRVAELARKTKLKRPENIGTRRHSSVLRKRNGDKGNVVEASATTSISKIPDSVIRISRNANSKTIDHPAVFPVALAEEMLTAFSDPGDIAFEPFCGSGSQIIAAQINDRICYASEIAPAYVDVTVKRWQAFSGQTAVLENDGRPFDQVALVRQASQPKLQVDSLISQ